MRKIALLLTCILLCSMHVVFAQSRTITGTVTDADDGSTLPGVSVVVKGTSIGTVTNINGSYSLNVPEDANTLVFSFVGMQTKEELIAGRTQINVILSGDAIAMDEVVVVAYGTQTRRSLTGSQSAVKGEELQKSQVSNITRALEGAVAGVQTTSSSGQPGSGSSVRIRGMGSLSASSAPLYVVDGVPFEGNINNLSQNDIESMTVLKDASATSLYGARAANGVILITTRRGTDARPRVNVESRVGINRKAYKSYDVMTEPQEYYEMFWEGIRNERYYTAGSSYLQAGQYASDRLVKFTNPETGAIEWMLGYNNYDVADNKLIDPLTGQLNPNAKLMYQERWEDEIFEPGIRQEHSVNLSGVSSGTNYFMSFNYLNDEGYSPNTGFDRYTARLRLDQDVNDWLKLNGNLSYVNTATRNPTSEGSSSANIFYVSQIVAPIYPVFQYTPAGELDLDANGEKQYDFGTRADMQRPVMPIANPAGVQVLNTEETILDRMRLNGGMEISFTNELKFRANISYDNMQTNRKRIDNNKIGQYAETGGYIYKASTKRQTINTNQLLSYENKFNDVHELTVLAGHEFYKWNQSTNYGGKQNYLFPGIEEMDWAVVMSNVGSYGYGYSLESYFGNINYGYDEKYYFDASIRRDGSSRFHPDNRWGTFWSAGVSWNINQEQFMQDLTYVDMLKLRVSYGSIGNDNLGTSRYYYQAYEDQYNVVNNDGEVGLSFAYKGNPDLRWESNNSFTVGLDYDLFNRISGNLDYFYRTSYDLLFVLPQAPSTGISEIPFNIGTLSNRGIEFEIIANIINRSDFKWDVSFNATHFRTTIDELPELYKEDGLIRGAYQKWEEGSSPYAYFMREFAGVNPETGQGQWYIDVLDEEGEKTGERGVTNDYNAATRYTLEKDAFPDVYGGISTNVEFFGFDLGIQTAFQIGGYAYDGVYGGFMHAGGANDIGANWHRDINQRWTPTNTNTDVPRVDRYNQVNSVSSRFLVKSDYFSIRNVVFGYTLPTRITNNYDIERLRIYVAGENLFFRSRRQGFDPRMYYSGVTTGADMNYSPISTVSVGLSLNF